MPAKFNLLSAIPAHLRIASAMAASTFVGGAIASLTLVWLRPDLGLWALAGTGAALVFSAAIFAVGWRLCRDIDARLHSLADKLAELAAQATGDESGAIRERAFDIRSIDKTLSNAEINLQTASRALVSTQVERAHSQSLLQQKNSERRTFFSRLSHELRSPLNAILGYTSILMEDADEIGSESMVTDLSRVRGAGQELLGLIDDLLGMVEDRVGDATRERVPFSLKDTVDRIAKEVSVRGEGPRLEPHEANDDADITIFGNRALTSRAVLGIFDHAKKYQKTDSLQYSVGLIENNCARISIIALDGGRSGSNNRANEQSVSLEVKDALAKQIGGKLLMTYRSDKTTEYQLDIPLDIAAMRVTEAKDPQSEKSMTRTDNKTGKQRRKALIVDDDPAAIDLLGRWLERCEYDVVSAVDAAEGLAKAASEAPDLVLLDALMPGKSGYDVLPELRALPNLAETPILMVTVDDDRVRGLEAGASDFVRKPVTESELRKLIAVYEDVHQGSVLIIDDDDDAAELLSRTVRRLGFESRRAIDGEAGLAEVRANPPRAILLDLNMPNVNGFQFIEELSRQGDLSAIPVIVVSAQMLSVAQHHTLLSAGAKFYLKGNAAPREIAAGLREAVA